MRSVPEASCGPSTKVQNRVWTLQVSSSFLFVDGAVNLFDINPKTGRFYLARPLNSQLTGSYTVIVVVTDSYSRKASIDINVIISEQTTPNPPHSKDEMKKTKTIYISIACALTTVTAFVFLGAFVAVYKLKKQVGKN